MGDETQEQQTTADEQLQKLSLKDEESDADNALEREQQAASDQPTDLNGNNVEQTEEPPTTEQNEQQPAALAQLDPALKQALLDSNRETVLKIEETVQQFLADSSESSLPFPPSLSNYQRLLEHKVSQHHQLETTTAFENGQPRVVAKRPNNGTLTPQQKLADIDVNTIKIAPKALIKRPPAGQTQPRDSGSSHHNQQHHYNNPAQQNRQLQRPQSHQEREADYHEARARIIGNASNLPHSGSAGNLANGAAAASNLAGNGGSLAGNRPASAGASTGGAALGTGYLAAVPPIAGDRGFNIVNPGRGMGRGSGSSTAPAAAAAGNPHPAVPGRGAGARSPGAVHPEPSTEPTATAAAAAAASGGGGSGGQRMSPASQQQQRHQQQQQQAGGSGGGPKAIYRDKQRDVQDPDYARGVDRYQQRFDPGYGGAVQQQQQGGMYVMPTYGSEFPTLAGAYGGQQQQQQQHNRPKQQQQQQQQQWQQQKGPAVNGSYQAQHKQQHKGDVRQAGSSGQQQQQPVYGPGYNQGYGAQGYPVAAGMYNQMAPAAAAAAGYGGFAAGGFPADYGAYGGFQYGYSGYGAMQAGYSMGYTGYGGYPAAAAGQWQGAGQQQHGGRGVHGKMNNGSSRS